MNDDIGKELALYRAEKGLRQADVAKALGVTQQTIGNWESGKPPRGGRLAQLRRYLEGKPAGTVEPYGAVITAPATSIGDKMEAQRLAYHELETEFRASLPEELRSNVEAETKFAGVSWRCDYLSAKVCAELIITFSDSGRLSNFAITRGLYQLATLKAIHAQRSAECGHYAMVIVGMSETSMAMFARSQAGAAAHGITIYQVPDIHAAAAVIADLEFGPMD